VSSCYVFAFYEPAKLCSACCCKTSQILLCHRSYRSHLFFFVLRISPLPRDFSVLSVSAPPTPSIWFYCLGQRTKQPRSQVLSPTHLSLSLSRSVGTGRREPWERGWGQNARRLVLTPFIGNCNTANFTLQLFLLFANKFHQANQISQYPVL